MTWHPDALLLQLFESIQQDLAAALERRQRIADARNETTPAFSEQADTIARLAAVVEAIEGALERRDNQIVH